ncbi:MAG: class I SAM-dependent methyltransferase [Crocinitomicaceae bacterium]|nr:class I SAM-dependent methyltransferase [Crocinitomicaceae bacterium]
MEKLYTKGWKDYELIDAGGGKKLERWGNVITIRPELQAYFKSGLPFPKWNDLAHWEYKENEKGIGKWKKLKPDAPEVWTIGYKNLTFELALTKFKHIGLFPEQAVNWQHISEHFSGGKRVLNLFAYTGAASAVARASGGEVLHVDSVKQLISWAKRNMELSGLQDIRWVHDDALKFAQREVKRCNTYDLVIMDPPAWGVGVKNEKWKIEDKLPELIDLAYQLVADKGGLIMNTYTPKVSSEDIAGLSGLFFGENKCHVSELWMQTTTQKDLYFGLLLRAKK